MVEPSTKTMFLAPVTFMFGKCTAVYLYIFKEGTVIVYVGEADPSRAFRIQKVNWG